MGLTASETPVALREAPSTAAVKTVGDLRLMGPALGSIARPNLICDPGYGCGTKDYFEYTQDPAGQTLYNETIVNGSTGAVEGCVIGVTLGVVVTALAPGVGTEAVGLIDGGTVFASCAKGIGGSVIKWVANLFSVQPGGSYVQAIANNDVSRLAGS